MPDLNEMYSMYKAAKTAWYAARAPYSRFRVGAAVLGGSGRIHKGCNCETAAYTGTHAEQGAIHSAVLAGETKIKAVLVLGGPNSEACPCCGLCLQALREFGTGVKIILATMNTASSEVEYFVETLAEVMTRSFGPENMDDAGVKK